MTLDEKIVEAVARERSSIAAFVRGWLEDWGIDLQDTADSYRDAAVSGQHNDRRIPEGMARQYAKDFSERADAVYQLGELLERDILARPAPKASRIARAAITAYQAEAWQPKMVKLTAEDSVLLEKALSASAGNLEPIFPVVAGFDDIRAAYIRGAKWSLEMGMRYKLEELHKAAYDYADKTLPPAPKASP